MPSFTFRKEERLKSRKVIGELFKKGSSINAFPLRLVWAALPLPVSSYPIQFSLTVPKRAFAKATQRNRIRRQIREAYRLHKHVLYEALEGRDAQFGFMIIYVAKETPHFSEVEKSMRKLIKRFLQDL